MTGFASNVFVTRFAPSPTGYLHLGHAFSALTADQAARAAGGHFLLRLEDIDQSRCRPHFAEAIFADLTWLGLRWPEPVRRQSEHMDFYATYLARLRRLGLLYPCFCTRKEIAAEIARSARAPHTEEAIHYPGTCRQLSSDERQARMAANQPFAERLHMQAIRDHLGTAKLYWRNDNQHAHTVDILSLEDVVLARKEFPASYHLAVTVDDAYQGISHIIRGEDLLTSTPIHRLLQVLLGLPSPLYRHHALLRDSAGERLAKRHAVESLRDLRAQGVTAEQIRQRLGFDSSCWP